MALWAAIAIPVPSSYYVELLGRHQKGSTTTERLMQGVAGLEHH